MAEMALQQIGEVLDYSIIIHMKINEIGALYHSMYKSQLWIKTLKVKGKTLSLLENKKKKKTTHIHTQNIFKTFGGGRKDF